MENDNNSETISNADSPRTHIKNEELLNLLRQLVEEKTQTNDQNAPEQFKSNPEKGTDDTRSEIKRLLEELLKTENAPTDTEIDGDDDVESNESVDTLDKEDDDDHTDSDLETVGYIVGGAALVGAGALLYHILRKH